MDPEELKSIMQAGPFIIRMNDGRSYDVQGPDYILIGQMSAVVLCKGEDGKWRNITLPLVTMTAAEQAA